MSEPLDRAPVEQGPYAPDPLPDDPRLWMSAQRRAAILAAEATDAEDAARQRRYVSGTGKPNDPFVFDSGPQPASEWQERKRLDDEDHRRRGVARMARAEQNSRDRRDEEDANRR